jgi:hypothetical protein
MRYRVEVAVGDWLKGSLWVDADSAEDAKGEAEEIIKNAVIEAVAVEEDGAESPEGWRKWVVWSQDNRSGQWLQVNEGFRRHAEEYADRSNAAAAKHGVSARYVACPEGTAPSEALGEQA